MSTADWASTASAVLIVLVLAVVARDRVRLRRRVDQQDARLIGLQLDLDAAIERIAELTSYLARPGAWAATEAQPVPSRLAGQRVPDRWSPRHAVREPSGESAITPPTEEPPAVRLEQPAQKP